MLKRLGAFFLDILEVIVFAVAIFLLVYLLILQPHKIQGSSMEPNFSNGEFLLTDKISYRLQPPQRGDVIVFRPPSNGDEEFIKRIVALSKERVMIKNGKVFVNAKELKEEYLGENASTPAGIFMSEGKEILLKENEYFVLGDNRLHSSDSRAWGPVNIKKITGKAWFIYWPLNKVGPVKKVS